MKPHNVTETNAAGNELDPHDLVGAVSQLLAHNGHPNPTAWQGGLHPDALNHPEPGVRRFQINRHLRLILAQVTEENTMDIRFCLVDNGGFDDWLRLLGEMVIPCMVKYQLPR
jgi:hypothetical protein